MDTPIPRIKPFILSFLIVGASMATSSSAAPLDRVDQAFFVKAAQAGATEIAASKVAVGQAANPEVKSFAEKMIKDHTAVAEELQELATKKGVSLPAQPSASQQAKIDAMTKLSSSAFDKSYASEIGVAAHQDTVALFEKTAAGAKDPEVKAFAAKTLPDLKHHLSMAKELMTDTAKK